MSSIKELRQRIRSMRNTNKMTAAMKLVASSKLKHSLHAVTIARPYAERLEDLFQKLSDSLKENHSLFSQRTQRKIQLCVITSDRGLCGAFNNHLIKAAEEKIHQFQEKEIDIEVLAIGQKGYDGLHRRFPDLPMVYEPASQQNATEIAMQLTHSMIQKIEEEKIDGLHMIYNHFESVFIQKPVVKQLFPLIPSESTSFFPSSAIVEPTIPDVLRVVVPQRLLSQIQLSILESIAGENGARMIAMDHATRNSSDLIEKLTIQANRIRQTTITTELTEIVSGAEALQN